MGIDFGFAKFFDINVKMRASCGTLSYVAPEVLMKNYTQACDMWSLGVVVFILLAGYMPFSGSDKEQVKKIRAGEYGWKEDKWKNVSSEAKDFTFRLLKVDHTTRMDAKTALAHNWLEK